MSFTFAWRWFIEWGLSVILLVAGVLHFAHVDWFVNVMPPYIPRPRDVVHLTGLIEIVSAITLHVRPLRIFTGWGLVAYFVAILPAHIHVAVNNVAMFDKPTPVIAWARIPFQFVFILWAWRFTLPINPPGFKAVSIPSSADAAIRLR